jgi:hypothetical protein
MLVRESTVMLKRLRMCVHWINEEVLLVYPLVALHRGDEVHVPADGAVALLPSSKSPRSILPEWDSHTGSSRWSGSWLWRVVLSPPDPSQVIRAFSQSVLTFSRNPRSFSVFAPAETCSDLVAHSRTGALLGAVLRVRDFDQQTADDGEKMGESDGIRRMEDCMRQWGLAEQANNV